MAPHLHDLFGFAPLGRAFELVLWGVAVLTGAALAWSERRSPRTWSENPLAWVLVAALVGFGGLRFVLTAAAGALLFPGGLPISTYGVAMALGFGVPLALGVRSLRRCPSVFSADEALDLTFWALAGGLIGARVLAWLTDIPHTLGACLAPPEGVDRTCGHLLRVWEGGLVFYGGLLGGLLGGYLWCRRAGVPFLRAADRFIPYVALGHAIGRLGCLAAGCCYGAVAPDLAWGVVYPAGSEPFVAQVASGAVGLDAARSLATHPVPLYEVALEVGLFFALSAWTHRHPPADHSRPAGRVVGWWLMVYAAGRFVLEALRGDPVRGFVARIELPALAEWLHLPADTPMLLSTSQAIALGCLLAGVALAFRRIRT